MRVFVTGATGYIGNAVALAFRQAGHSVTGLTRSQEKGRDLKRNEIIPVVGDLSNTSAYADALKEAEVVVHCAFDPKGGPKAESRIVDTILSHTSDYPRAFLYTSGVWVVGNTKSPADESSPCHPIDLVKWRLALEERLLTSATPTSKIAIIRPGCVYGGAGSLTSLWFEGTKTGSVEMVGDGHNHWTMIHTQDLANAYVLAAEKELNGMVLNIVDDTTYTVKEMASAVAAVAGIPGKIHSITPEEGFEKHGQLTQGFLIDQKISNERARRLLGWYPRHKGFIQDIEVYYNAWKE